MPRETSSTMDWERQMNSDAIDISDQEDVEPDSFWDALSSQESDMEDETFWDALLNPDSSLGELDYPTIEKESSWKVETEINEDKGVGKQTGDHIHKDSHFIMNINSQTMQSTSKRAPIRSIFSSDFRKSWNRVDIGKSNGVQSDLKSKD